jgi:hypothetical protein
MGNVMKALAALCATIAFAYAAPVFAKESLATFASNLAILRDDCAKQAQTVRDADQQARFKEQLDMSLDQQKAKLDAQTYAVGHGGHETTQYYLDQSMAAAKKDVVRSDAISGQFKTGEQAVKQCVVDAQQKGKNAYAYYKDNRENRKQDGEARSLMVAWMANLEEIGADNPQGTDATKSAWNTARIEAQL